MRVTVTVAGEVVQVVAVNVLCQSAPGSCNQRQSHAPTAVAIPRNIQLLATMERNLLVIFACRDTASFDNVSPRTGGGPGLCWPLSFA